MAIFTFGVIHLVCWLFFYDRNIGKIKGDERIDSIVQKTLENHHPTDKGPSETDLKPQIQSQITPNSDEVSQIAPVSKKDEPHSISIQFGHIHVDAIIAKNICDMDSEAIVNAANRWLIKGAGVCGAIYDKGGQSIFDECKT